MRIDQYTELLERDCTMNFSNLRVFRFSSVLAFKPFQNGLESGPGGAPGCPGGAPGGPGAVPEVLGTIIRAEH